MKSVIGHPRNLTLSRYVDGGLSPAARGRVEAHLRMCHGCRETVDFLRDVGEAAREAREPSGAQVPDVADEVIRRRAQGERVALDVPAWAWAPGPGVLRAAAAILLLALGGAAVILTLAPSASASRSELAFTPDAPAAGERIEVQYSPAYYLADEDSLRLRARARRTDTPYPRGGVIGELRVATLHRIADGTFTGSIWLEPDDVFLAAVVEDFDARNVDTNFGELWELFVRTEDGAPSTAALESRYRTLEPYNWVMATAWAEEITERWPENPFGWALLYFHESRTRGEALPDSVVGFHRRKLAELVEAQPSSEETVDDLAWLAAYARFIGDSRSRSHLLGRLAELDPNHPEVIDQRVIQALSESERDPRVLLDLLEVVWSTSDGTNELLGRVALETAVSVNDVNAVRSWLARAREVEEITATQILDIIEPLIELAPLRAVILQGELVSLESAPEELRPLRSTRDEYGQDLASELLETQIALARSLVDAGNLEAAAPVTMRIVDVVWKPEDVQPVADLLLATGDTMTAIALLGLLIADPIEGSEAFQEHGSMLMATGADSAALLNIASERLSERVISSLSSPRIVPDGTNVSLIDGSTTTAGEYFGGRPTVLLMWWADVGRAAEMLDEFEALAAEPWVTDRIRAAVVAARPQTADLEELGRLELPAILDRDYELAESLRAFAAPMYVVLDSKGRVRATIEEASTAFRIAHQLAGRS